MKEGLTLRVEHDVASLGPEWDVLFADGAGLQTSRAWFAATIAAAIPADTVPSLVAITDHDGPALLVPMLAGPGRQWQSLTTPYTCFYQPLIRHDPPVAPAVFRLFGRFCRPWPLSRFEALDPDWGMLPAFRNGLAAARLVTRTFAHFGNWHERIPAEGWSAYLHARPGQLRETIKRRTRAATKAGAEIKVVHAASDLPAALAAYEEVYGRSWKEPEPFPAFNAALVDALAPTGVLRIGVMSLQSQPIAAQYWSVVGRKATVLKLAHDENLRSVSPGTVLTAATIRALIEHDDIVEIDFGRGDDVYKRGWASQRRERIGLLGLNVMSRTGMLAWVRHDIGRLRRALWRKPAE